MSTASTSLPTPYPNVEPIRWHSMRGHPIEGAVNTGILSLANPSPVVGTLISSFPEPSALIDRLVLGQTIEVLPPFSTTAPRGFCTLVYQTPALGDTSSYSIEPNPTALIFQSCIDDFDDWFISAERATSRSELANSLENLHSVVSAISNRATLRLSDDVEQIIEGAARFQQRPEDLEAWARRLAEDVGDLTD